MLAADKLQLQSSLKQQATALKEKEFNLHHSNLMTVGTQAAVLAGLDMTMFVEFTPPPNSEWNPEMIGRSLKFFYYICITCAFCANMLVVSQTTVLSVLGASMALRGPDGSMMTATDGLYEERTSVFTVFAFGLACTLGSVVLIVWINLHWEASLVCMVITILTCRQVYNNYHRVRRRFDFDESETVDFRDIFDTAANIHTYRQKSSSSNNNRHFNHKKSPGAGRSSKNKRRSGNHRQSNDNLHDGGYPIYDSDNEEMQLMMTSNYGSRSGNVQRRIVATASGNSSAEDGNSRNGDSYSHEMYIQTV